MTGRGAKRKLLICPFCGGEAELRRSFAFGDDDAQYTAECKTEGCAAYEGTSFFATEDEAAKAWNTRAERTCHRVPNMYADEVGCCSECGGSLDPEDHYCWKCGAKVVGA